MKLLVIAALVGLTVAIPQFKVGSRVFTSEEDALFERFKTEHGKAYYDEHDESYRKGIFLKNLNYIRTHNAEADAGKHTYTLAMNEFGDLPFEEFHAKYTGFLGIRNKYLRSQNVANLSHVRAPDSKDWTSEGAVTAVKNQGQCGSCWSFSATGSMEGAWQIKNGKLISLSEQQLMDCSKGEGNNSCEGGLMDYAFEYVINDGNGMCTEDEYSYKGVDQNSCNAASCSDRTVKISSYQDVAQNDEDALKTAVAQQPVSVAIEADQSSFQFYSGGVLTGECGTSLDHGVLAVGYGTLDGTDYWKVKNSWGESWGMSGYVLIQRNKDQRGGQCGIAMAASYPVV